MIAYNKLKVRVLSDDQLYRLHLATLEILERTGIQVFDDEAVDLLAKGGAYVTDGNRVKIPGHLVNEALRRAPERVVLCTRDGKRTMALENDNIYFGTGSDCPFILDSFTGERRKMMKADVAKAALLCDSLDNIDFVMSLGLVSDFPTAISDRHQIEAMMLNTTKPIVFTAHDRQSVADIVNMAVAVAGSLQALQSRPFIALYAEPSSPLRHSKTAVQKLLLAAELLIPVVYTPCPMAGATAPATLAGTLVMSNAELLSGLVITQLKNPGAPFIYGGVLDILDMSDSIMPYGSPELHLLSAALTDLAHFYKLPMFGTAGCSDSKVLDQQAGIESALSTLMAALSGANLIHDVGYLESALTGSYEMIVMTNEIIGMVKHIVKGIEISEETVGLDLIDKVGPGGNFITELHTLQHFRREFWFPQLFDRKNYSRWAAEGKLTLGDKVHKKVREILAEYTPKPVGAEAQAKIKEIIKRADKSVA